MPLSEPLESTLAAWAESAPTARRQEALSPLADWIRERATRCERADLVFVCTHNSRRSHIAQLWAQAAAYHCGLANVVTWSGGTEATAFNPRAVRALRDAGFGLEDSGQRRSGENIVYRADCGEGYATQELFSKVYSDDSNPQADFAAVMVCDSADAACPLVPGAALRIALPFVDPKRADDAPDEAAVYAASAVEIGQAMAWLMRAV